MSHRSVSVFRFSVLAGCLGVVGGWMVRGEQTRLSGQADAVALSRCGTQLGTLQRQSEHAQAALIEELDVVRKRQKATEAMWLVDLECSTP